ncbi:MAG: ATP-dependent Clp protease ATP-binding subunit [Ruminococcaceae bacterium]|nr:ATP-dependent Clp protease ATP-binding subunit [Oscillospiraceae bacterium]
MWHMCSRCKVRPAVVFITKIEGNEQKQEGLCLKCAKELNIKPVTDVFEKMGIGDEEIDTITGEMADIMEEMDISDPTGLVQSEDGADNTGAPAFDLRRLFMNGADLPEKTRDSQNSDKSQSKKNKKTDKERKFLSQFCIDLTSRAKDGKLDNIIGRDKELERMIQILCRRQKNNPCLIGEPGVGKTALAEALAQRIVAGKVPFKLRDKEVFIVDMTSLVAGTQFRGQFENRIRGLIEEVKNLGNIILVIDEVHTIVGTGDAEGGMNAANILKPALSRGEIQLIGATTLAEYRKYIEKDAALERRFQPVMVNEPSVKDTVDVIMGIKKYYESFHGIVVPEEVVEKTVVLSERYITDRFLPDKAIDLLDEACARVALESPVINRINELQVDIKKLKEQREALENLTDPTDDVYSHIADVKVSEIKAQNELDELTLKRSEIKLREQDLAKVIEVWTGVPASDIAENDFKKLEKLSKSLSSRIIGQEKAIDSLCRAIKRSRVGIAYKRRPVSFIFAGPTGVGKTELVKTLARELFDSPEALIRLDMSEFMEKHSVARIIGAPPGYVGYDEAGQLTEKIRRKPYSVVLFDEIEKAHPDVMNILLQILDDGMITDAHGKQVNFENAILIMTTNAGSAVAGNVSGFNTSAETRDTERTEKALSEFLRPEFLNRVDEVITFNRLKMEEIEKICEIQLGDLKKVLERKAIEFSYTPKVVKLIANESFSDKYGARNVRRYIQTNVEDKIAEEMIVRYEEGISYVSLSVKNNSLEVECK